MKPRFSLALASAALAGLSACAYRLPPMTPPSLPGLQLAAPSPERYVVRLKTGGVKDYAVPPDGSLTLEVPGYGYRCRVYLFNWIRVGGGADPLKAWRVEAMAGGKSVGKLPLDKLLRLPVDESGRHVWRLPE